MGEVPIGAAGCRQQHHMSKRRSIRAALLLRRVSLEVRAPRQVLPQSANQSC